MYTHLRARSVKHSLSDDAVKGKLPADKVLEVEDEVEAALRWVQTNQVGWGSLRGRGAGCGGCGGGPSSPNHRTNPLYCTPPNSPPPSTPHELLHS